jgi:Asp-tRNA(Asn)/Glu-tRNA(Gln) amidotransferase A subunit family amidase
MPIGVQVAGRPFEDEKVLAVATAIEHGFGYRPPPLAVG